MDASISSYAQMWLQRSHYFLVRYVYTFKAGERNKIYQRLRGSNWYSGGPKSASWSIIQKSFVSGEKQTRFSDSGGLLNDSFWSCRGFATFSKLQQGNRSEWVLSKLTDFCRQLMKHSDKTAATSSFDLTSSFHWESCKVNKKKPLLVPWIYCVHHGIHRRSSQSL